eukprot:PhM_4_TR9236/c1_g1_i1/m.72574
MCFLFLFFMIQKIRHFFSKTTTTPTHTNTVNNSGEKENRKSELCVVYFKKRSGSLSHSLYFQNTKTTPKTNNKQKHQDLKKRTKIVTPKKRREKMSKKNVKKNI